MGKGTNEMSSPTIPEIEQEIHRTEAEMGETIDEIQRRLSPQHLAEQAREALRDAGARAGAAMTDTVRRKPWIPALIMAGVGGGAAAWYVASRKKKVMHPAAYAHITAEPLEREEEYAPQEIAHPGTPPKNRYGIGAAGIILGVLAGALVPSSTAEAAVYGRLVEKMKKLGDEESSGSVAASPEAGRW